MTFQDDLLRHAEQIKQRIPHVHGEEATKQALVVPFLQVLGFDVYDPREVRPEYIADFAKKKSNGQMEKIDYAILLGGEPVLFFECKAVDAHLDDHDTQLARYFNATPSVKIAVITNGARLKVFGDLQQPNIMDPTPWLDVDLLGPKPTDIDALKRFRKLDFSASDVLALAEEMVYFNALVPFLSTQLREPTESFVRFVAGELGVAGRVTQKVVERLTPIFRKAVQAAVVDHVARSFDRPVAASEPPAAARVPSPAPTAPAKGATGASSVASTGTPAAGDASEARAGVVTTPEELRCFNLISSWVHEVVPAGPIAFRDSKTYFTIHQANVRKWFVRLNVTKTPYWVSVRGVAPEEARRLAPGLEVVDGGQFGDSRAVLASIDELQKLRVLLIAAYDRETRRVADDTESGSDEPALTN